MPEPHKVKRGQVICLNLIASTCEVCGIQACLEYSSDKLEYKSYTAPPSPFSHANIWVTNGQGKKINFVLTRPEGTPVTDPRVILAEITMKVLESCIVGELIPLVFDGSCTKFTGCDGSVRPVRTINHTIEVIGNGGATCENVLWIEVC